MFLRSFLVLVLDVSKSWSDFRLLNVPKVVSTASTLISQNSTCQSKDTILHTFTTCRKFGSHLSRPKPSTNRCFLGRQSFWAVTIWPLCKTVPQFCAEMWDLFCGPMSIGGVVKWNSHTMLHEKANPGNVSLFCTFVFLEHCASSATVVQKT